MSGKIISVINQKGGVGKTTTVINLAAGLTMKDKRILVIDLDPQGNATTGLGLSNTDNSDQTIYSVLNGTKNISEVIQKTNIENLDKQTVSGILTIPDNADGKVPLVIGVAGSSGWGEHHFEYLKMYQDMGIATFQLQSFKSRNETSTVGTQNTVTHAMIILDSYRALEKLSENPKIDIEKVAITGWS